MTQAELLIQAFGMIVKSGVCKKTPAKDWIKILLFLHKKGYLYISYEDEKLMMIACMYRVPKLTKETENTYPEKEKGNILYIPFFVSQAEDNKLANRLFKRYLDNHPKVKEICFYERGDEHKLRRFKRKTKESKNGKEKVASITSNA